jgi:hypothetical protein
LTEPRDPAAAGSTLEVLVDGLLLSTPPLVLVGVFLTPVPVRESLVFAYEAPTLATAFAANYVHFSVAHLATNVLGYLLLVAVAYLLCRFGGFGDLFRVASVGTLVAMPAALSLLNLAVPRPGSAFGFSGVVMSFYGVLCFALGRYAERRVVCARAALPRAVFFAAVGVVALVGAPTLPTRLGAGGAAFLAAAGHVAPAGRVRDVDWPSVLGDERRGGLLVAGTVLVATYPVAAFPADPTVGGTVVNLYGHFLGFALGFLAVWCLDLVRRVDGAVA